MRRVAPFALADYLLNRQRRLFWVPNRMATMNMLGSFAKVRLRCEHACQRARDDGRACGPLYPSECCSRLVVCRDVRLTCFVQDVNLVATMLLTGTRPPASVNVEPKQQLEVLSAGALELCVCIEHRLLN